MRLVTGENGMKERAVHDKDNELKVLIAARPPEQMSLIGSCEEKKKNKVITVIS